MDVTSAFNASNWLVMLCKVVKKLWAEFLLAEFLTFVLVTQQAEVLSTNGDHCRIQRIKEFGDAVQGGEETFWGIFTCGIFDRFACNSTTKEATDKQWLQPDLACQKVGAVFMMEEDIGRNF